MKPGTLCGKNTNDLVNLIATETKNNTLRENVRLVKL